MLNIMSNGVKEGLKTTARISFKVLFRLIYLTTAFIFSVGLTVGLIYYIGLHYYENYYKEYMTVQQSWSELDEGYISYINTLKENQDLIETTINSATFKKAHSDEFEYIQTKLNTLKTDLTAADFSMSYQEKFATYPPVLIAANELIYYLDNEQNEELQNILSELKQIQTTIDSEKKKYNDLAVEFNQINKQFPEKYFAELASFNDWPSFQ